MGVRTINARPERYVLCVDDDPEFLKSLEVFLPNRINADGDVGPLYRFVFLQDPAETLVVIQELVDEGSVIAMLISDQQMPVMKGTVLLERSRQITADSVRVLLTGHAGIEAAIIAINERLLDRYLTKPIDDEHGFTLNVKQLLQRFEMSRVIEAQASALQGLYGFANEINAREDLAQMAESVVRFTRSALDGCEVCVVIGETPGGRFGAAIDATGVIRVISAFDDSDGALEDTALNVSLRPGGVGDISRALSATLRRHGVEVSDGSALARLTSGSSSLGFIIVGPCHGRALTEPELQTLDYIADTTTIAIHKQLTWAKLQDALRVTQRQAGSLEEANQKLTLLDQMKTEFLRFISHELRTPLTYMSAIGLLEGPVDPAEQAEMAGIVRKGYERLERLINKGLDYLYWCGTTSVESEQVTDLAAVVRVTVESLKQAGGRELELELDLGDLPGRIVMESDVAEEIVRILLENAVKFSGDRVWVRVEIASSAGRVTLSVADRGRGFPPELAAEMFRPFTVMDTLHHSEGTALNLAMVSAMLEAHGGCIHADSEGKGAGARFTIELPAAPDSGVAESDERAA